MNGQINAPLMQSTLDLGPIGVYTFKNTYKWGDKDKVGIKSTLEYKEQTDAKKKEGLPFTIKDNIASGRVLAHLQVDEKGLVTEVRIVEATPRRVFDREVIRALSQWEFQPEGDRYIAEIEVNFTLKD